MRAFVPGGAGFIGSHAVERLLATPAVDHVTVFDEFFFPGNWIFCLVRGIG